MTSDTGGLPPSIAGTRLGREVQGSWGARGRGRGGCAGGGRRRGLGVVGDDHQVEVGRSDEPLGDGVVEQAEQGVEVAGDVEHADRPGVQPERGPGQHLEEFFIRADAAGQRRGSPRRAGPSGPCARASPSTTCSSVSPPWASSGTARCVGDHAHDAAPVGEHGVGDDAHQAGPPAAVDQADPAAAQGRADPARPPRRSRAGRRRTSRSRRRRSGTGSVMPARPGAWRRSWRGGW